MNKILLSFLAISMLLVSCKKDSDDIETPDTPAPTGTSAVPATFTQKVLLEIFTGAGQPQCTDGFVKESDIIASYPSIAIPVRIHYSDAMEIPYYTSTESTFNNGIPPTFPSAMINRTPSLSMVILNRSQWMANFLAAKSKTATCGLAVVSSVSGTTATIEVHAGFKQALTGTINLTVMLTEANVTGAGTQYDQRNSYNTTAGHSYYGAGDPILGFNHSHTLRKVLTANLGDAIPTAVTTQGGEYVKTFTVNISGYKAADLSVVAFINKTGTSSTTHEVLNAQKVALGSTQNWD
jgi:Outer membrane protein Omp28